MRAANKKLVRPPGQFRFFAMVFFIVVFIFNSHAETVFSAAGVPKIINFQGRLMDSSGNLLGSPSGTDYCFRFGIWDVSTGGTANPNQIWPGSFATPTTMTLPVRSGVFDVSIGGAGGDTLDFNFQDNDTVYVNVEVATKVGASCTTGGDEVFETLDPRPQIVSSAYAINSGTVGGRTPAQSATDNQIPVLTSGLMVLGHATAAGVTSVGAAPLAVDAGSSGVLNLNNTSTGNILLGGGSASTGCTLTNSSGAFACASGITGVGVNATSGLLQGALGLTVTGAAVSLNASSNFDVNIATGTSTGDITLGGGTAGQLISINSDDWDISTSGVLTGISGITSDSNYVQSAGTFSLTSANTTQTTTSSAMALNVNSLTTGTGLYIASSTLSSGSLIDLAVTGTAGIDNQKGLNISLSGANGTGAQTTYGAYLSNTHTGTSNNVGLYATASGGTNNYAAIFDQGQVLIGGTNPTSGSLSRLNIISSMASSGSTTAIAGIHGEYTINPSAGGTQVGNRFVMNNAPTSTANTSVNQIIRTIDNTSLANTVRGLEIVSNAGSNTAGTNTGIRTTGATFGLQAFSNGAAGGVSLPAAIYGESTGTTQGDVLRLYTGSMTSALAMQEIYHDTSTFSGAALLMDMAKGSGTFNGNFLDLKNNSVQKFKVTSAGVTSMGLSGTASTNAVCSSLANATAPTAGTAYEIRDCNAAPAADYAEAYPVENGADYGDIMVTGTELVNTYDTTEGNIDWTKIKGKITKLVKSTSAYQKNVIGIVSDNHGDFTSAGYNIKEEDNPKPIALNGRVPVKVSGTSVAIEPGDYLTTSAEPGRAEKAAGAGYVIGKALESWSPGQGVDMVMVFVEQGYYNGQDLLTTSEPKEQTIEEFLADGNTLETEELNLSDLSVGRLTAGLEIMTPKLTATLVDAGALTVSGNATFAGLTVMSGDAMSPGSINLDSQVEFNLAPIFNNDTAGFAIVKEGDKSVHVSFEKPYAMTPVVTTSIVFEPTDNIDESNADTLFSEDITSLVVNKDSTGFTIILNKRAPQNIRFSWIALGVKDAKVFESLGEGLDFISQEKISSEPSPEIISEPAPEVIEPTPTPAPFPAPDTASEPAPPEEPASAPEIISEPQPEPSPEIISEPAPEVIEPTPAPFPAPDTASEPASTTESQ